MVCEVKHVTACNPVVSTKCANINYQECAELPAESQTSYAQPLPVDQQQQAQLGQYQPRQGRRQQKKQQQRQQQQHRRPKQQQQFAKQQQQQRFFQQQNGQFVRHQ